MSLLRLYEKGNDHYVSEVFLEAFLEVALFFPKRRKHVTVRAGGITGISRQSL